MLNELITRAIKIGGFMEMDRNYLTNVLKKLTKKSNFELKNLSTSELIKKLAKDEKSVLLICDLITPSPSVVNAYFAEKFRRSPEEATEYYFSLLQELGFFEYADKLPISYFLSVAEGEERLPARRFIRMNLKNESWGFQALKPDYGIVFPSNKNFKRDEKDWLERMLNVVEIFPHCQVQLKNAYFDVFVQKSETMIDVLERYEVEKYILLTIERLAPTKIRLTGYNYQEIAQIGVKIKPQALKMLALSFGNQLALEFELATIKDTESIISRFKI